MDDGPSIRVDFGVLVPSVPPCWMCHTAQYVPDAAADARHDAPTGQERHGRADQNEQLLLGIQRPPFLLEAVQVVLRKEPIVLVIFCGCPGPQYCCCRCKAYHKSEDSLMVVAVTIHLV
jgi:hypothetical protein